MDAYNHYIRNTTRTAMCTNQPWNEERMLRWNRQHLSRLRSVVDSVLSPLELDLSP